MTGVAPSAASFCANAPACRAGRVTRMPTSASGPAAMAPRRVRRVSASKRAPRRARGTRRPSATAERVGRRCVGDAPRFARRASLRRRRGSRAVRAATARRARTSRSAASGVWQLPDSARAKARSAVVASVALAIGERRKRRDDVGTVGAAFDRERALPGGRQAFLRIEQRRDARREAEPLQARGREDDRVVTGPRRACAAAC